MVSEEEKKGAAREENKKRGTMQKSDAKRKERALEESRMNQEEEEEKKKEESEKKRRVNEPRKRNYLTLSQTNVESLRWISRLRGNALGLMKISSLYTPKSLCIIVT
jgi:hypothetical protein